MLFAIEGSMRARPGKAAENTGARRSARSWLAVGLLLVQLLVTAGHFHREDFALPVERGSALAATQSERQTPLPSRQPMLPAHDDCALCFSLQLAGGTAMPHPVLLPLPAEQALAVPRPIAELRLAQAPSLLFRTRAPPIA
jgi:hypothetical protein